MSENCKIEWCHHTFNAWWGCFEVSPGCDNCYARELANRFGTKWGVDTPRREFGDKHWNDPIRWNAKAEKAGVRHRVFCSSMADVFDKNAPEGARERLWALIEATPHLDWLLLTKRIGNARQMISDRWSVRMPDNVWLGISAVNQEEYDRDIKKLLQLHVSIHFISFEPLLDQIDLFKPFVCDRCGGAGSTSYGQDDIYCGECGGHVFDPIELAEYGLDWVIVGGESGKKARPMHPDWVRKIRDQCKSADVPFLFKQHGEWVSVSMVEGIGEHHQFQDGATVRKIGKKAAGRLFDGMQHDGYPESKI